MTKVIQSDPIGLFHGANLEAKPQNVVRLEFPNYTLVGLDTRMPRPSRASDEPILRAIRRRKGLKPGTTPFAPHVADKSPLRRGGIVNDLPNPRIRPGPPPIGYWTREDFQVVSGLGGPVRSSFPKVKKNSMVVRTAKKDFAANVILTLLENRSALHRVERAVARNVELPAGDDRLQTAVAIARRPWVIRAGKKIAKVSAGATAGYLAGRRWGGKAGAAVGAIGALAFEDAGIRRSVQLAMNQAKSVTNL